MADKRRNVLASENETVPDFFEHSHWTILCVSAPFSGAPFNRSDPSERTTELDHLPTAFPPVAGVSPDTASITFLSESPLVSGPGRIGHTALGSEGSCKPFDD